MNSISIDLGCGQFPRNPFKSSRVIGIDIGSAPQCAVLEQQALGGSVLLFVQHDAILNQLPFETGSIDFVTAYDFLEHVPRCIPLNGRIHNCFISLMDEIFRVLKPAGLLFHKTPCAPHDFSFVDPTHVNHITAKSMHYFCGQFLDKARTSVNQVFEVSRSYGIESEFVLLKSEFTANRGHLMQYLQKPTVVGKRFSNG